MPTLADIHHEHDYLVGLLTALKLQFDAGEDPSKLISKVSALLTYAEKHFCDEDEMMKDLNFFDYDGHKETHALFIKMSMQLYNTLLEDPTYLPDVIRILTDWFTTHIEIEMFLFAHAVSRLKHLK